MAQAVCTGMEQVLGHPRGAPYRFHETGRGIDM
jgi:hypothetical protein